MKIDYLVVGQGLAGTVLSLHLLARNRNIRVIDEFNENSSSRVAAGLFNPITGKKFVKTWNAHKLFPYLHQFYPVLEKQFGKAFFYPVEIYRPFSCAEEQNDWQGHSADPSYSVFIEKIYKKAYFKGINDESGGMLIKGGGFVDMNVLLDGAKKSLTDQGILINEKFEWAGLDVQRDRVNYQNIEARKVLFCSGVNDANNEFFNWLPFRPVKGEVLHLKSSVSIERIYNKGCFITPALNGLNRCGSTYDWRDRSPGPTKKGRDTILSNLKALIHWNVDVVDHKVGVRPASLDRRPMIGLHPEYKSLGVFNGLGAKGVTLAPFYADQFVKFLEDGTNLDREVNIERYYSLYYKSFSKKK